MPKLKPDTIVPSEKEDNEINEHTREDGTLHSDRELMEFKGFEQSALPESFKQIARRRGRPPSTERKVLVSIRYSPEVIEYFRATGKGWQTRMDDALKQWIDSHSG